MKYVITNNTMAATKEFPKLRAIGNRQEAVYLPKGTVVIIRRYGTGFVRCEVCSAAEALASRGIYREADG